MQLDAGRFFGARQTRYELGSVAAVVACHAAASALPLHAHARPYLCVARSGTYEERYGRRRRIARAGVVIVHPAGERHCQRHREDVVALNLELDPTWVARAFEAGGTLDEPCEIDDPHLAASILGLLALLDVPAAERALGVEHVLLEVVAATRRGRDRAGGDVAAIARAPGWLRRACAQIVPREVPSLAALARDAGVHPVHFAATFRRSLGCSVGEYHRRLRVEHAARLLARRPRGAEAPTLAEVALEAGFADQSHFTRAFKRVTGQTPAAYRTLLAFKTR